MGIKVRRVFDKLPDNPERNTLYFVQRKINPLYMDIYDVDYNGHIAQYTYQFDRDDVIYGKYIDETVFSVNNKQFKLEPNKIYIDIDTKITYIYLDDKLIILSSSNITSGKIKTIEELDAADKAGIYSVTLPENYLNFGTNHFFLMVGDNNDIGEKKQIAFLNDDMRMRVGTVGSWGVWKSIKEETLKALKQNVSTTTQLIKIYTENGFILKENGETASASGYVVYKFNVTGKTKVAVIGHSHTTGFCLACAYDVNGVMLQNYAVAANADFTKEVIALPAGTNYINVCGTTSNLPAAYDVSERWIFYTTQEIDDKLANFNTEVHHDLTLKGNGKPDDNLSVNEEGLNSLDKYFVNTAEKFQISVNKSDIASLQGLWSNYVKIQNPYKDFVGTVMNLEKGISHYGMSLSANSTVSFNTTLLDNGTLWAFDVYFNISNFISVAFPQNVFFYGGNQMLDIGKYHYHFESKDNGVTWIANLVSKQINYVSPTGKKIFVKLPVDGGNDGNDGLTWATAKATLKGANAIAIAGDIVMIKSGKYLPSAYRTVGVEKSRSFVIKNGVNVYGGFQGTESNPDERVMTVETHTMYLPYGTYQFETRIPTYQTIWSGEITGDGIFKSPIPVYGSRYTSESVANNSTSVVYANLTSTTIIDGFVIQGGKSSNIGAAVYSENVFLHIKNAKIKDCTGLSEGGICYFGTYTGVTVEYCDSVSIDRGGMWTDTKISHCDGTLLFRGFANFDGSINKVLISENKINYIGYMKSMYNFYVKNCIMSAGLIRGGTIVNFLIENNIANYGFGNIYNSDFSIIAVCGKCQNNTSNNGYSWIVRNGDYISNIALVNNKSKAGTITSSADTSYIVTNITVINNDGISHSGVVDCNLINSVVWGNKISGLKSNYYSSTGTNTSSYCAFEDETVPGTANISISSNNNGNATSPKFVAPSTGVGVTTDNTNYDIANGSFLIDKGNNAYPNNGDGSLYDCKGRTRKKDTVDIGAYENQKL